MLTLFVCFNTFFQAANALVSILEHRRNIQQNGVPGGPPGGPAVVSGAVAPTSPTSGSSAGSQRIEKFLKYAADNDLPTDEATVLQVMHNYVNADDRQIQTALVNVLRARKKAQERNSTTAQAASASVSQQQQQAPIEPSSVPTKPSPSVAAAHEESASSTENGTVDTLLQFARESLSEDIYSDFLQSPETRDIILKMVQKTHEKTGNYDTETIKGPLIATLKRNFAKQEKEKASKPANGDT
jgi:hypothetical protein